MIEMLSGVMSSSMSGKAAFVPFLFDAEDCTGDFNLEGEIDTGLDHLDALDCTEAFDTRRTTSRPTVDLWTTSFIHKDGLGSVRALTDEAGAVVDLRSYEAFGTKNVEAGSDSLAYGFAGEPLDGTTHLAYHRARWMDSRVGRFAAMDAEEPKDGDPRTLTRYVYTRNESTDRTDPSGNDDNVIGEADIARPFRRPPSNGAPPSSYYESFDAALGDALALAWAYSSHTWTNDIGLDAQTHQEDYATDLLHAEYAGYVYFVGTSDTAMGFGNYNFTKPATKYKAAASSPDYNAVPAAATIVAIYHTHPNRGEVDLDVALTKAIPTGGTQGTFCPDQFSPQDAASFQNAQQEIPTLQSLWIKNDRNVLFWLSGSSAPYFPDSRPSKCH